MRKSTLIKITALILGLYVIYRFWKMQNGIINDNTNSNFVSYGVNSLSDIKEVCKAIANKYHFGANKEILYRMLLETAVVETNAATAKDTTATSGRGLFQFDKIGYDEAKKQRLKRGNTDFQKQIDEGYMGDSILLNAYFACYMARMYYLKVSKAIPNTLQERANYWKTYYNSIYGAGTPEHYIKLVNKWLG